MKRTACPPRAILLAALCLILLAVLAGSPRGSRAQDETPAPGEQALTYLPPGDAFGPGWRRFEPAAVSDLAADTFVEGATVLYGGPEGARVTLTALIVGEGRVRRAWEEAGILFENVQYNLNYSYERIDQLRNVPPPPGCAEAKRIDGPAYFDGFMTGVTLCAADPDLILLAVASGTINDETGFAAADNVIVAALEAAGRVEAGNGDSGGGGNSILEAYDIGWSDARLRVAPGDTIVVVNTGIVEHSFVVVDLEIKLLLQPGERGEVTLPADTPTGSYEFICEIPGHAGAGMRGELIVE